MNGISSSATEILMTTEAELIFHPARYASRKPTSIAIAPTPTPITAQFAFLNEDEKDRPAGSSNIPAAHKAMPVAHSRTRPMWSKANIAATMPTMRKWSR